MQFNYLPDWVIAAQTAAVSISKITRVGPTATATVASTAALATGQYVTIYGPLQPEYAGSAQITVTSGTTFTYQVAGAPITPATVAPFSYTVGTGIAAAATTPTACAANNANYSTTFQSPPFYAADFNRLAYNPNVNYTPPVKADGTPLTHTIGTDTDVYGNQAFFAKVQTDPFGSPATYVSLSSGRRRSALLQYRLADHGRRQSRAQAGRRRREWRIQGRRRRLVPDQRHQVRRLGRFGRACGRRRLQLSVSIVERHDRDAVFLQAARQQDPLLRHQLALLPPQSGRHHGVSGRRAGSRRAPRHQADLQRGRQDLQPCHRLAHLVASRSPAVRGQRALLRPRDRRVRRQLDRDRRTAGVPGMYV